MLQSYQGPTDSALRSNAVEGYTQVSRIGESVINSFVDSYEFGVIPDTFTDAELRGDAYNNGNELVKTSDGTTIATAPAVVATPIEHKPHFYE